MSDAQRGRPTVNLARIGTDIRSAGRVRLTESDYVLLSRCRREHTHFGLAYQIVFYRLTGRLPQQRPFEMAPEVVRYVAGQLRLSEERALELAGGYAASDRSVFQHQAELRSHLGVRTFEVGERQALRDHLCEIAAHLERPAGLVAHAEAYLRDKQILLPAVSTLRRLAGEVLAEVAAEVEHRIGTALPDDLRSALDSLLAPGGSGTHSPLQALKDPPGAASPRALVAETDKLSVIRDTGVLRVDLSWLRASRRKALAHRVRASTAHRLRELKAPRRYAALVCFLHEAYADTVDHVIDLHAKLVTQTYRRAERRTDDEARQHRRALLAGIRSLREIGRLVLDETVADEDLRQAVLGRVSEDHLRRQVEQADEWLSGHRGDVFADVARRLPYIRRFSPSLVGALDFEVDPAGGSARAEALVESVGVLRVMNEAGKRRVPEGAPTSFLPASQRRLVERRGEIDRAAYEAAVLTALRDEIRRGNVAVGGSKRFGRLSDLFMPDEAWQAERVGFFERAALPPEGAEATGLIEARLRSAYDRFCDALPGNAHVTVEQDGLWRFASDAAEAPDDEDALAALQTWLDRRMQRIRLPDLLIEADNALHFTRHLTRPGERSAEHVCEAVAAVIAYGCNLGPQTMAQITDGVSYDQIKRLADWHLHGDTLRAALADVVGGIAGLDTALVWGEGRTASSDGQRFLFPRRTLKRTYSHRMSDYALEFYTFVADNYAPFYSAPIECTERDAGYVLDGLLYHESDLEIDEHYTDTHGYTEVQFAAFALLGKRFAPRIRGLHKQRIYRTSDDPDHYGPLWPMLSARERRLRLGWVADEWDRIGRFFCSVGAGHTTASVAMKRVVAFGGANHFYRAVRELGRALKTEFVLDYATHAELRRRIRRGLLKSEELHALARAVFYGKRGQADARDFRRQASTASCLTLILACVVYWQIREIERVVAGADGDAETPDFRLLAHISPVQWDNVTLYGAYDLRRELVRP